MLLIGVKSLVHNTLHLTGRKFETHWYENSTTGQRVEPKTIVEDYLKGPK